MAHHVLDVTLSTEIYTTPGDVTPPFAWNPLDEAAIEGRQHEFVKRFEQWDSNAGQRWSDETMLRNPAEGLNERQQG